jgi:GAF domain-containing protein
LLSKADLHGNELTDSEVFTSGSQAALIEAGVPAVLSTPLISSTGRLLGIVSTHFSEPHRPTEREL